MLKLINTGKGNAKFKSVISFVFFLYIALSFVFLFLHDFSKSEIFKFFDKENVKYILSFFGIYLISHLLRLVRLYTLLLEEKIRGKLLLQVYLTTSWVNFLLPYKLGEIFRITEIGYLCKSLRRGIITIWIERFFDAVILSTIILIYIIFYDSLFSEFLPVTIVLTVFVGFSLLYYIEYRYSFKYLTQFLLSKSNTSRGVLLLKLVDRLKDIHSDIRGLIRGRTSLLLFLSFSIWIMELAAVLILSKIGSINYFAQSFVVLLNESLIPSANSNYELILLYKSLAIIILTFFAIPFIVISVNKRIVSLVKDNNNKDVLQQYKLNDNVVIYDDLEDTI